MVHMLDVATDSHDATLLRKQRLLGKSSFTSNFERRSFDNWHFAMLNDHMRNAVIESAIKRLGLAGKTVFEIGAGAGLTAMMFAKYGAAKIVTCEINEQLYKVAKRNIRKNGFSDRIDLRLGSSTQLMAMGLINFQPDVIFTETLDCGVVGEGFYQVAADITQLAGPYTAILPSRIRQHGYLVNCDSAFSQNHVGNVCEFDLSALNDFRTKSYFPIRSEIHRPSILTDDILVREYDYTQASPENTGFTLRARANWACHGMVTYFEATFGDQCITNDVRHCGHWHQAFHPLAKPIMLEPGRDYQGSISDQGTFTLDREN
jgi:type I protein arginine methyltransferase